MGEYKMLKSYKSKLLLAIFISLIFTQSIAQFEIRKHSINNGGGKMSGGQFELSSSIGQTDAKETISGGNFSLNAGFWQENTDLIFKNSLEN
jgi:hypothetical protein